MPSSRSVSSGWDSANPGVTQAPIREGTRNSVPSARTRSARARHDGGSGNCAADAMTISRVTRSGRVTASCSPIAPPRETPA